MVQSAPAAARPVPAPVALWRALPFTAQLLAIGMLVGLLWFLASRAANEQQLRAARERNAALVRLQRAEVIAGGLGTAAQGMSRAHRGYLLSGQQEFLEEYARQRAAFDLGARRLLDIAPTGQVSLDIDAMRAALARWRELAFIPNVALRRAEGLRAFEQGRPGAAGVLLGAALMDTVTAIHDRLARDIREEARLVEAEIEEAASRDEWEVFLTSTGALAVLLLLLTLLMRLVQRELALVVRAAEALDAGRYRDARLPDARTAPNREVAQLAATFEQLAASIEERERQLQEDIVKLKELDRLKRDFVSTVSHELRTPLTSMRGALGLILGGKVGEVPPKGQELLRIAMTNTERLIRLINDILDIEKADAGQMALRHDPLRVRPLVDTTLAGLDAYARDHGVTLVVAGAPGADAAITGDADRLTQVLTNLISNAVKYSPRDAAVEVEIVPGDGVVSLRVRDHGPGIPEEFTGRIFGRFQQAGGADSRRSGGTGLGLNIARTIVELHGGRIGFEPAEGGGTVFWFTLPTVAEAPLRAPAAPAVAGPGAAPRDQRKAVLVVEDDPSMRDVLVALVDQIARAIPVHSAEAAQEVLAREPVAAIILDPGLPGMDGFSFAKRLRQDPRLRTMPLFLFSAREYEPEELRRGGIRAADAYVKTRDAETVLFDRLRLELAKPR